jgi:16S rRNA (cytosine1402-N4)-methyltransferase
MHKPVLKKEVVDLLSPKTDENLIDCTLGEGGHSLAILERTGSGGKILGIDRDPEMINNFKEKIKDSEKKENFILVCDNFANLKEIVKKNNFKTDFILLDLGFSSWHLENSKKGFSFKREEPLDMRYNPGEEGGLKASNIVNIFSQSEIEKILKEYGQEPFARKIALKIVEVRKKKPIESTFDLVEIIKKATPFWYQKRKIHFATLVFQALRIFVNKEIENLKMVLPDSLEILNPGGKLAIISFHSLEDRIVKNFFKEKEQQKIIKILTKKPIIPSEEELKTNPRSRSAKLRVAEKKK